MTSGNQLPNLDKIFRDDAEQDFLPSGGSNLAAIFGLQGKPLDNQPLSKQQSFKKISATRNPIQTVTNKTEVIIAKAVHAFKLQNGTYVSIGKLGMALTGNAGAKVYQIILYKGKQEHVSTVTITCDFLYVIQANNYSSYYDKNKENWSILFENNDICIEFAREIALAKYFCKDGRMENVLYQDLSPINKVTIAKEGDYVSIKYFITSEITQPFKSNLTTSQTMTVEISTDNNWERTLLGSSKGLKRILFLPPSKQISLGPGFPKEKDVILEIEIINIKTQEETTQTHKVTSGKASIISRMAKMGQSILPKVPLPTTTDSEDTEDDVSHKSPRQKRLESEGSIHKKHSSQESIEESTKAVHKALKPKGDMVLPNTACKPFVSTSTFSSQWSPSHIQPNFITLDGQAYSLQSQTITPTISTVLDPGLNVLVSETRMANAELRMGMSRIADNVQKLLDKFHDLELQNATSPVRDKTTLDTALKMLLTMNAPQSGEKDVQQQKSTDRTNNDNLTEINDIKIKADGLEKELHKLRDYITELEAQKLFLTNKNEDLYKNNQELESSLKDINSKLSTTQQDMEEAKRLNIKYDEEKVILEDKMSELSKQYNDLEKTVNSVEAKENDIKNKEIKRIMNNIYHALLDKFVDESYSTEYIKSTIASTIKNATLQVLYSACEENTSESKVTPNKTTEPDTTEASKMELESSDITEPVLESEKETEISESTMIHMSPAIQDEPPPIPPMDTEDDNDWLHL